MIKGGYKKKVSFIFETSWEVWEITSWSSSRLQFENEDTSICGGVDLIDDKWAIDPDVLNHILKHRDSKTAQELKDFFDTYGPSLARENTT